MKKDKRTGRFTVNPNSKRQQKLRAKAMGAATPAATAQPRASSPGVGAPQSVPASAFAGFAATPPEPPQGASTAPDATADGAAHGPSTVDTAPSTGEPSVGADGASHVDDYFSPVDTSANAPEPEVLPPVGDDNPSSDDAGKGTKRTKRKDKFFSAGVVEMLAGGWSTYVGFRHDWISRLDPNEPGTAEIREAATINDTEKSMLTSALQEYMAETDFELTPGEELALVMGMVFAPRLIMLEGALYAGRKHAASSQK